MNGNALSGIYNYRAVDDRLATSGQPTEAQFESVAQAGFTTVINLALHDDPRYSLPDEPGTLRSLGLRYVHIPVSFAAPTERNLLAFFDAMDNNRDEKIWVHCAANIRASVFLGLYRVIRLGWPQVRAFELMRNLYEPNEVWDAFIQKMLEKPRK
jgi:protein tyrosine phosphatase (PTP) superfamily phosphohydrolase (DUF442 family)